MNDYKCVTTIQGILDYLGDAKVVAFDYETSPDEKYREHGKAHWIRQRHISSVVVFRLKSTQEFMYR